MATNSPVLVAVAVFTFSRFHTCANYRENTHNTHISQHSTQTGQEQISVHKQREQTQQRAVCVLGEPPPTLTTGAEYNKLSVFAARIERGSNLCLHEIFRPPRRRDCCGLGTGFALRPDAVHGAPSRLRGGLTVARPRRGGAAALRV